MEPYIPPFTITDQMINQIAEISELIGKVTFQSEVPINPQLRRENRIKTIQASLAIENNTLTIEQVTAIINGKRILGAPGEIKEVQNAYQAYEILLELNPLLIRERQQEYYRVLGVADKNADSSIFVEFMLQAICDALQEIGTTDQVADQVADQVKSLVACIGSETLSATAIMQRLKLSHRATFRANYLNPALAAGLIERTIPDKPNSRNQRYIRK